jgi:hypothetical protein
VIVLVCQAAAIEHADGYRALASSDVAHTTMLGVVTSRPPDMAFARRANWKSP